MIVHAPGGPCLVFLGWTEYEVVYNFCLDKSITNSEKCLQHRHDREMEICYALHSQQQLHTFLSKARLCLKIRWWLALLQQRKLRHMCEQKKSWNYIRQHEMISSHQIQTPFILFLSHFTFIQRLHSTHRPIMCRLLLNFCSPLHIMHMIKSYIETTNTLQGQFWFPRYSKCVLYRLNLFSKKKYKHIFN